MNIGICENISVSLASKQRIRGAATKLPSKYPEARGHSLGANRSLFSNDLPCILQLLPWKQRSTHSSDKLNVPGVNPTPCCQHNLAICRRVVLTSIPTASSICPLWFNPYLLPTCGTHTYCILDCILGSVHLQFCCRQCSRTSTLSSLPLSSPAI